MTRSFQIHLSNQISSNPSTNILSLVTFITDLTERHEQSPNLFPSLHRVLFFNRNARNILVFSKYMQCARFIIIINYCILALRTVLLDTRNARNARKQTYVSTIVTICRMAQFETLLEKSCVSNHIVRSNGDHNP